MSRLRVFRTIQTDPPWPERGGGRIKRGADRHYPLIKTKQDILRVHLQAPVWRVAEHAHLYMWVTNNYLPWGLWLMDALGFRYITNLPWDKGSMGVGQYFRGRHELCLFGVRGKGKDPSVCTDRRDLDTVIRGEQPRVKGKRKHSAKSVGVYEKIEARSKGPYLEMFARVRREKWTSWGQDIAA